MTPQPRLGKKGLFGRLHSPRVTIIHGRSHYPRSQTKRTRHPTSEVVNMEVTCDRRESGSVTGWRNFRATSRLRWRLPSRDEVSFCPAYNAIVPGLNSLLSDHFARLSERLVRGICSTLFFRLDFLEAGSRSSQSEKQARQVFFPRRWFSSDIR